MEEQRMEINLHNYNPQSPAAQHVQNISLGKSSRSGKRLLKVAGVILLTFILFAAGRFVWVSYRYPGEIADIEKRRKAFAEAYDRGSPSERKKVIREAGSYLEKTLVKQVFPAWYGTPWSMNGNTDRPLRGFVACGVFVVNCLRDSGFNVPKRMAAQPSLNIIKNLVDPSRILDRTGTTSLVPVDTFLKAVERMGEGVFLVGLDTHVGFLYHLAGRMRFVHSSGYLCVIAAPANLSPSLRMSDRRVLGKLFDVQMMDCWFRGGTFPIRFDYFKRASDPATRRTALPGA
jgi:hypothetical protein